ncbi:hypothetical protein EGM70_08410 [Enterobacteriaceae bacterium 89]|nr:hypothetical protein [Enterobacteriaceae bacterium 89]
MSKIYIIENCLLFNEETQALSIRGEHENTLSLPAPSSRLLSELIKNNGTMVSREVLLAHVWEDYGYRASNSNLNNYLSILRRNLSDLLPQSTLITTLPKQGIIFQAEVDIIIQNNALADSEEAIVVEQNGGALVLTVSGSTRRRERIPQLLSVILSVGALLAACIWYGHSASVPAMAERLIFTHSQCRFYQMQDTPITQNDALAGLKKFDINLNCEHYPWDVFLTHYEEPGKRRHMAFVAWCQRAEGGKYTRCENSKMVSWGKV